MLWQSIGASILTVRFASLLLGKLFLELIMRMPSRIMESEVWKCSVGAKGQHLFSSSSCPGIESVVGFFVPKLSKLMELCVLTIVHS